MELRALKYGDLMGSPDIKDLLLAAGPGSEVAHDTWAAAARIKWAFGWTGHATSVLLLDPSRPDAFPAWVDPSWITPDPATHGEAAVDTALEALAGAGHAPEDVRTVLVTHDHMDHVDPRVLGRLPNAVVHAPDGAIVPGATAFDPERLDGLVAALDTPGHWGPHVSYVVDLEGYDATLCLAGDLIMSHAHLLALDHPLSCADHDATRRSLRAVLAEMDARPTRFKLLLPGHDRPVFVTKRVRGIVDG